MISLAFDTSNKAMTVALLEDGQVLADFTLNVKKNHSISLMPTIDFIMQQAGLKPSDLDRIIVAKGPGSYTGLRVAVATAKTLAYSLKIDLVGVSSLQAIAANVVFDGMVIPLIDARRNNVYVGFYNKGKSVAEDRHASLDWVIQEVQGKDNLVFVGETTAFKEQLVEAFPHALVIESLPSAVAMGRLGEALEPEDYHAFVPDYLERVEAEENWLQKQTSATPTDDYIKRV